MYLTKKELLEINGGAVNWTVVSIIGTAITFIAGIIDGYLNPIKCNK
ncbi:MAG: class IIb bacteriocin, lactobin A/cerein 7B family [Bacilli bacterium]|nr:class IIb bacteriocin, lactobin A/cerein 7B family [Bacilli bacterium]